MSETGFDRRALHSTSESIIESNDIEILRRIKCSTVDLALYKRKLSAKLCDVLGKTPLHHFPSGRFLIRSSQVHETIYSLFSESSLDNNTRKELAQDICSLAKCFVEISGTQDIDIRLETVTHDACWKFHRDCVSLRLLTTYKGPGTQIVPDEFTEKALADQRDYGGPFVQLGNDVVALFKGSEHETSNGVLHRSPPISRSGEARYFLCLNLPSRSSPELYRP